MKPKIGSLLNLADFLSYALFKRALQVNKGTLQQMVRATMNKHNRFLQYARKTVDKEQSTVEQLEKGRFITKCLTILIVLERFRSLQFLFLIALNIF